MTKPGMAGYCKLCASQWLPDINRMLAEKLSSAKIERWVKEASKGTLSFNRQTLYAHRDNRGGHHHVDVDAPATIQPGPSTPVDVHSVSEVTNDDLLGKVRDLAFADLEQNPAQVTLKMGLEAVKILESRKQSKANVLVLAKVFTRSLPRTSEMIEGEFTEVSAQPAPQLEEIASGD
jgi:hypothetical protein